MAYGIKGLVDKFKAKGKDVAEAVVLEAYETVKEWLDEESAKGEHGMIDAVVKISIPQIDPFVRSKIDAIDGQIG